MTYSGPLRATQRRVNKFAAVRTELDGHFFGSRREAAVYAEARLRERAGEIVQLRPHPKYHIVVQDYPIATYTADLSYRDAATGVLHVVDVKSPATAKRRDFVLTRKLMWALYRIDVEIWH